MVLTYRRARRKYLRPVVWVLSLLFFIDAVFITSSRPPTFRTRPEDYRAARATQSKNTTVFIASVHRNNEEVLKSAWNTALLDLVDYFGAENVYVSSIESGSQDNTKSALWELKGNLYVKGVDHFISLGMDVWQQLEEIETRPPVDGPRQPGWIWNEAESQWEMRRIPYLSRVRNEAMGPLKWLQEHQGRTFDKVLWLNDVVFDTEDIVTLLDTNEGEYAAACSMDYKSPPLYYDTFALRDDQGLKTNSLYWPWFQSPKSNAAAQKNEPVQVESCWNGIVAFDAEPYYADPPLEFRGVPDSLADLHLEGSECCLVHADNYLSRAKGVWLNPNVRVGYSNEAYYEIRTNRFPSPFWAVVGAWVNRLSGLQSRIQTQLETRTVRSRVAQWEAEGLDAGLKRYEPGEACLINEMQIMWSNGWKHL